MIPSYTNCRDNQGLGEIRGELNEDEDERKFEHGRYSDRLFRHFFFVKIDLDPDEEIPSPVIPPGQPNILYHFEAFCIQRIRHIHGIIETIVPTTIQDLEETYNAQFSSLRSYFRAYDYIEKQIIRVLLEEGNPFEEPINNEWKYKIKKEDYERFSKKGFNLHEAGVSGLKPGEISKMMNNFQKWIYRLKNQHHWNTKIFYFSCQDDEKKYSWILFRLRQEYTKETKVIHGIPRIEVYDPSRSLSNNLFDPPPIILQGARILLVRLNKKTGDGLSKDDLFLKTYARYLRDNIPGLIVLGFYLQKEEKKEEKKEE